MSASLAYLLDTNILSDLVRNPQGVVAAQITKVGEDTVCTSIIVAAELHYGAIKSNFAKLSDRIDMILSALEILPLETRSNDQYAAVRYHLTREATSIGQTITNQRPDPGSLRNS